MSALTITQPLISHADSFLSYTDEQTNIVRPDENVYLHLEELVFIDLISPQTTTIGAIEATVRSLKDEFRQFIGRYADTLQSSEDTFELEQFSATSIRPKMSRQVILNVEQSGRGKPTVAFDIEDLLDDEINNLIIN